MLKYPALPTRTEICSVEIPTEKPNGKQALSFKPQFILPEHPQKVSPGHAQSNGGNPPL